MVENQHKKISGYRDLTETEIGAMNDLKDMERRLLVKLDQLTDDSNGRHIALAKTHLETGFMFAVKAIAKPEPYYVETQRWGEAKPSNED